MKSYSFPVAMIGRSLSQIYAILLICTYSAFKFTEVAKYPNLQEYLEANGFFVYICGGCVAYLLYVICFVVAFNSSKANNAVDNHKSHGSVSIRHGIVLFGLVTMFYFATEMVAFFQTDTSCRRPIFLANIVSAVIFVVLQAFLILMYPRLNILRHRTLNRFGMMHIVATNLILWIRTLVYESVEEIAKIQSEMNDTLEVLKSTTNCSQHRHQVVQDVLTKAAPYLFPFIIEYLLIGAGVAFLMDRHIGKISDKHQEGGTAALTRPNPSQFLENRNCSNSTVGFVTGTVTVVAVIICLVVNFSLSIQEQLELESENIANISNSVVTLCGVAAVVYGVWLLRHDNGHCKEGGPQGENDQLDMVLLYFTGFFSYLYMIFTIITGAFHAFLADFAGHMHIVNGVLQISQIALQTVYIKCLKHKDLQIGGKKGPEHSRQLVSFLILYNLSQWIVVTFELPRLRTSLVEANFYGLLGWVVIQRLTLPLAVFFRFHSAIVFSELWKGTFH